MIVVDTKCLGNMSTYFLTVTSKHHCLTNTHSLQLRDSLSTVFFNLVVDDDMSCVFSVNGNMDDGTHMMAVMPLRSNSIHQLCIANTHFSIFYFRFDSLSCYLFHIRQSATVCRFIGEGITKGGSNGMGRVVFHMGCQV